MSNIYKKLSVGNLMAMAVTLPMVANTTNTASSPLLPSAPDTQKAARTVKAGDVQILRINPTLVEIVFANQQRVAVDFYGESVFRIFEDHNDGVMRAPEAKPEASILVDNPRTALNHKQVKVEENDNSIILSTTKAQVIFDKATQLFRIINLENGKTVAEQSAPAQFTPEKVTLSLREQPDEYFFGGGVQNGRFSHKGEKIEIVNTNNWVDGGVASPAPFYWSTAGYGFMWYTFKPGLYDFGSTQNGKVELSQSLPICSMAITSSPATLYSSLSSASTRAISMPTTATTGRWPTRAEPWCSRMERRIRRVPATRPESRNH